MSIRLFRCHNKLWTRRVQEKNHVQFRLRHRRVEHSLRRWQQSFNLGDWPRTAGLLAEHSVLILPDARMVRGRRTIARVLAIIRTPGGQLRLEIGEINVGRRIGVANGTAVVAVGEPDGRRIEHEVRFTVTWARPGGVLALILHSRARSAFSGQVQHPQQAEPTPDRGGGACMA